MTMVRGRRGVVGVGELSVVAGSVDVVGGVVVSGRVVGAASVESTVDGVSPPLQPASSAINTTAMEVIEVVALVIGVVDRLESVWASVEPHGMVPGDVERARGGPGCPRSQRTRTGTR